MYGEKTNRRLDELIARMVSTVTTWTKSEVLAARRKTIAINCLYFKQYLTLACASCTRALLLNSLLQCALLKNAPQGSTSQTEKTT